MAEWYSFRGIKKFTPDQIVWILRNEKLLSEGVWPPEPTHSGYIDVSSRKKRIEREGHFVKAITIIAEVKRRLEHCGFDGLMVYLLYADNWMEEDIAKYYKLSPDTVVFRAKAVLRHIAGQNFYARPYRRFNVYRSYDLHREVKVGLLT